jgi:hypothetical protein
MYYYFVSVLKDAISVGEGRGWVQLSTPIYFNTFLIRFSQKLAFPLLYLETS